MVFLVQPNMGQIWCIAWEVVQQPMARMEFRWLVLEFLELARCLGSDFKRPREMPRQTARRMFHMAMAILERSTKLLETSWNYKSSDTKLWHIWHMIASYIATSFILAWMFLIGLEHIQNPAICFWCWFCGETWLHRWEKEETRRDGLHLRNSWIFSTVFLLCLLWMPNWMGNPLLCLLWMGCGPRKRNLGIAPPVCVKKCVHLPLMWGIFLREYTVHTYSRHEHWEDRFTKRWKLCLPNSVDTLLIDVYQFSRIVLQGLSGNVVSQSTMGFGNCW